MMKVFYVILLCVFKVRADDKENDLKHMSNFWGSNCFT